MGSRVIFFILVLTTRTEFSHAAGKPHFNYNFTAISTLPSTSKKCYVPKIPNTYAYTIKPSLSYREQTLMLQKHNEQRRLQGASDMMIMNAMLLDQIKLVGDCASTLGTPNYGPRATPSSTNKSLRCGLEKKMIHTARVSLVL
ncbi:hypothetical protein RRG08_046723 [Elysia crispata]|uniref:SCP domain-containing protein n=1 Tax=Elysia crispata TaxID=231223 RepID=A0AAE1DMC9_9GAST|nr:hypothetical protein RRG08_046723 [Elysia crispata]